MSSFLNEIHLTASRTAVRHLPPLSFYFSSQLSIRPWVPGSEQVPGQDSPGFPRQCLVQLSGIYPRSHALWDVCQGSWWCPAGTARLHAGTVKILKIQNPKKCCNYPKIWTMWHNQSNASKGAERTANSVDPDQTAPENCSFRSCLVWVFTICQDLSVETLLIVVFLVS